MHDANLPGHTVELDDGWAAGYADHAFNQPDKFPDPKAMIAQIHAHGLRLRPLGHLLRQPRR